MRRAVVVLVALTLVLAAGCGSSEPSSDADEVQAADIESPTTETTEGAPPTTDGTGTLEGTYELTGPAPGLYECSFATEQLVMTVSGDQVTIDEADGLITGTLTPQGEVFVLAASQPDNNIGYTITITVTDGGDAFTATNDEQSRFGGCSFEFTGTRTSMEAAAPTTTTIPSRPTTTVAGGGGSRAGTGDSSTACQDPAVTALVREANPGSVAELGICEGGWAVVFWYIPDSEGSDRSSTLRFEGGSWQIVPNPCPGTDMPPQVQVLACQTQ